MKIQMFEYAARGNCTIYFNGAAITEFPALVGAGKFEVRFAMEATSVNAGDIKFEISENDMTLMVVSTRTKHTHRKLKVVKSNLAYEWMRGLAKSELPHTEEELQQMGEDNIHPLGAVTSRSNGDVGTFWQTQTLIYAHSLPKF